MSKEYFDIVCDEMKEAHEHTIEMYGDSYGIARSKYPRYALALLEDEMHKLHVAWGNGGGSDILTEFVLRRIAEICLLEISELLAVEDIMNELNDDFIAEISKGVIDEINAIANETEGVVSDEA